MFTADQPRGKKRLSTPYICAEKKTDFNIYTLPEPRQQTPKATQDLELAHAGKRIVSLADHWKHTEIVCYLEEEFPKLKTLKGGWMFYKASGGSGRRKLAIIPTDSEGYSTRLLKAASNNGKNIFLVPLQENLSTDPLPFDSPVFSKMPQSNCITCGCKMPLQLLPLHVEQCNGTLAESTPEIAFDEDFEQPVAPSTQTRETRGPLEVCPICLTSFPPDILQSHASTCGDITSGSPTVVEELPGPSAVRLSPQPSSAWMTELDPQKACQLFREELLDRNSNHPHLSLSLDMFEETEEQDSVLISFYKLNSVNWAAPFKCKLKGDAAVGVGVKRHVLSVVMQKLKTGFSLNLGSSGPTPLFEGEKEHRVPSASAVLRESKLFEMAGRMIGHSFLHGGPGLTGLSLSVVTLVTGGSRDAAASALTLLDCPDLDHRETIGFLQKATLSEEEKTSLIDLCLSWDLPVPTPANRDWLYQELLTHAVLNRVMQPIKQIRKGLKNTGIWPLLLERPDVGPIIFPRESDNMIDAQTVIQSISWPNPRCDSDDDEDDFVPVETVTRIVGFLRQFIEEASTEELRCLMKFWVGWEQPPNHLVVEVLDRPTSYPVAQTCLATLRLPSHYKTYHRFHRDLIICLKSVNSGFGLV